MNKPLISVIVPVYNVEKYLCTCIDSILNQTFQNFEIILIDDGSTDNSGVLCDYFAEKDERIVVIHKENNGVGAARNSGLDICKGLYIFFVDSDDFLENNCLEYLYNKINLSNYDIVSCCANFVNEKGKFIQRNNYQKKEYEVKKENLFDVYMSTNFIEDAPWNKLYKKEVFENLRFKENIIFEDSEIIIRILKKINLLLFTSEYAYNYRIRSGSILNYEENNIEKKSFTTSKLDLLAVYESSYYELIGTKYEKKYIKRILQTCSKYWYESRKIDKTKKKEVRNHIKIYFNKYKWNLFDFNLFPIKECIYILLNVYFR